MLPSGIRLHYRLTPWWVKVVVVYLLARLVTTVMLLVLASVQGPNPWTGAQPGYFDYASIWDGRWYDIVAEAGYPKTLPIGADGSVQQNAWAFLPAYPFLVRAAMTVTFLPWSPAAVLVSLGFGLGAALLFHRLLALRLPFLFHHARQPVGQGRQPVADSQPRQRRQADEQAQGEIEDVPHRRHPRGRRARAGAAPPRPGTQWKTGRGRSCRKLCIKCGLRPRAAKGTYRIFA